MNIKRELSTICRRYSNHGITMRDCVTMMKSGIDRGLTPAAALTGLRMGLASAFGEHEYFTAADVAEATGESPAKIERYIQEHEEELYKAGYIAKVHFVN